MAQSLIERGAAVSLVDAMRFTHPLFRAVYRRGGLGLITRLPRLYHLAYAASDQPAIDRVLRGPRYRSQQISTRVLFRTIEAFKSFDLVMGMTGGGPGDQTELIAVHLYRQAFLGTFRTGISSALAYIILIIIIAASNLYIKYLNQIRGEG